MVRRSSSARTPSLTRDGDVWQAAGRWTARSIASLQRRVRRTRPAEGPVTVDCSGIARIDTSGALMLRRFVDRLGRDRVSVEALSDDGRSLYDLVSRDPTPDIPRPYEPGFLEDIGRDSYNALMNYLAFLSFIGALTAISVRILLTPARMRWSIVVNDIEEAGFDALPIVGLLSFLMGVVIAYQGGVLLQQYGAGIFIADLVGLSMLRELSPLLTAIIVAGRTGSAYTAQIGTMKVTEEVDALRTMGIAPMELLVLPKLFALVVSLPLLTVFADVMGVFGGMVMSSVLLEVTFGSFIQRFTEAVNIESYLIGIGKAPVFAAILASVGCYQGFKVTGSAESVGQRTTICVVECIFLVIVVDAVFSVIFSKLGI